MPAQCEQDYLDHGEGGVMFCGQYICETGYIGQISGTRNIINRFLNTGCAQDLHPS